MLQQIPWVERKFNFNFPAGIFPTVLERFRGTPARLENLIKDIPEEILIRKLSRKWSVKEHAGHLIDLEELNERRLKDFLKRSEILSPADITNRATDEAGYNSKNIKDLISEFAKARGSIVKRLEKLDETEIGIVSLHPRLRQQMRIVDWIYFMCEHDDHHLYSIRMISVYR